jgi:hypothetical protein
VPPLAEIQQGVRRAIVTGDANSIDALLIGGRDARKRLAIHQRHYETSLTSALVGKFPATAWLVGTPFLSESARHFVREHPPNAPCIAEYGEVFPAFLATCPGADRVPYLHGFAMLDWHLGHVAVAVDRPVLTIEALSQIDVEALLDERLSLQPGVRYLRDSWPIDDLMKLYLTGTAPDRWTMDRVAVSLEIRGARGAFQIARLETADFAFRTAVLEGRSIANAAGCAIESDAAFDPARALAALVSDGLVTGMRFVPKETTDDDDNR